MYTFIITIHIIVCILLILIILFLQQGRGGGISETLGGGTIQSILGTQAAPFLNRTTAICATVFLLTSLGLTVLSTYRTHSIMVQSKVLDRLAQTQVEREVAARDEALPEQKGERDKEKIIDETEKKAV